MLHMKKPREALIHLPANLPGCHNYTFHFRALPMTQMSFSDAEYASKKKLTRRDRFLAEIEAVTPWSALVAAIEPVYSKGDGRGRPPIGVARMLRMYVAQQCFGLSDEGIEDAIYDSQAIRNFVGIDLNREPSRLG